MTPGRLDLRVCRWAPFLMSIDFTAIDISDASAIGAQVRQYRDAPGYPLLDLQLQAVGTEGLSVTLATVSGVPTSTLVIQIDESTLNALLPFPDSGVAPGSDVPLVWDLVIESPAFGKRRWLEGAFIIHAGVTH